MQDIDPTALRTSSASLLNHRWVSALHFWNAKPVYPFEYWVLVIASLYSPPRTYKTHRSTRYPPQRKRFPYLRQEFTLKISRMSGPLQSRLDAFFRIGTNTSPKQGKGLPPMVLIEQPRSLNHVPPSSRQIRNVSQMHDIVVLSRQHETCRANESFIIYLLAHVQSVIRVYASRLYILVDHGTSESGYSRNP